MRRVWTMGIVLIMVAGSACSGGDDSSPDYAGLSAYLTDAVGEISESDVKTIYTDPPCSSDDSILVLNANFATGEETDEASATASLEIVTQVAVDFFLCGHDYATEVISAAFADEGEAELFELLDQLEPYSSRESG
jgi:hypothetical protein